MSKASDAKFPIVKIEDEAHFDSLVAESDKKLIFIDMHEEWCGPCDALAPTLTRVFAEYDACTERMTVCSASITKLGEHIQKALPSDAPVHLEKNGCLPAFALFRHNQCVGVISGVDGPAIISAISNNIPDKPIAVAAD